MLRWISEARLRKPDFDEGEFKKAVFCKGRFCKPGLNKADLANPIFATANRGFFAIRGLARMNLANGVFVKMDFASRIRKNRSFVKAD